MCEPIERNCGVIISASEDKPDANLVNSKSNLVNSHTNSISPDAKLVRSFENLTLESLDTSFEFFNGDSYADMALLYAESPSFSMWIFFS